MTDKKSDLIVFIEEEERLAESATIEGERKEALEYYLGKPFGNEVEGRSQVVLRDVADTVEWIKPSLLKIFTSGDEVVSFVPQGPEDVPQAEQETDYINYLIHQKNNGFLIFHDWFMDALLSKNGYVKVYWEEEDEVETEKYETLSEDQLAFLMQDKSVEIVEAQQVDDGMGGVAYNVKLKVTEKGGHLCIENLRPESVLVSHRHRGLSVREAPFVEHWEMKSISQLREEGYEVKDDVQDSTGGDWNNAEIARRIDDKYDADDEESTDPSQRMVRVREVWCEFDEDGDGIAEDIHAIYVGRTEIWRDEEGADCNIASLTPTRIPHRHDGLSIADWVMDLQLIRSTLLRQGLDNNYLANNGRNAIDVDRVNLDDMLTSRPGGIVRIKGDPSTAIVPLVHTANGQTALQMIEYIDTVRENRTGITKYNQGMDSNTLNKTATGINAIQNASQQRIELIARLFAETGVKELFHIVHEVTQKHSSKAEIVQLRNKWVTIDPREWKKRTDMSVSVGLGMGNKDQQAQHMQMLMQMQMQGLQIGVTTPKNLYNSGAKYVQALGYKNVEDFLTDPATQPPKPPPVDPKVELEKARLQHDVQSKQADLQISTQQSQMEAQQTDAQMQQEFAIEQMKIQSQAEMEKYKVDKDAETKIAIATIQANLSAHTAEMTANAEPKTNVSIDGTKELTGVADRVEQMATAHGDAVVQALAAVAEALKQVSAPRQIVRDHMGRATHTAPVTQQ